MVVFGLVLLVVALAVVAFMWLATRGAAATEISYGFLNVDATLFWMFLAGGITLAAATCGLWLIAVGTRSRARRAKEVRQLRRAAQSSDGTRTGSAGTGSGSSSTSGGSTTGASAGSTGSTSSGAASATGQRSPILPRPGGGGTAGGTGTTGGAPRKGSVDGDR